jgi:hypothetical protein
MSDEQHPPARPEPVDPQPVDPQPDRQDSSSQGPSLTLMYSLIALALATAIGFALMIVLPFHDRH